MKTTELIAAIAAYLPAELLALVVLRLVLGEEAEKRTAQIRDLATKRQRRRRGDEAVTERHVTVHPPSHPSLTVPPAPPKHPPLPSQVQKNGGARLPENWEPNEEDRRFALVEGGWHETDMADGIRAFRNLYRSKVGEKGLSLDWSANWQVHVDVWGSIRRRTVERQSRPRSAPASRPPSGSMQSMMGAINRLSGGTEA